jgi:hypothetical protein
MNDYEYFNILRIASHNIGDRLFFVLDGWTGITQGRDKPEKTPTLTLQYEIRNIMVPLNKTVESLMKAQPGDRIFVRYEPVPVGTSKVNVIKEAADQI